MEGIQLLRLILTSRTNEEAFVYSNHMRTQQSKDTQQSESSSGAQEQAGGTAKFVAPPLQLQASRPAIQRDFDQEAGQEQLNNARNLFEGGQYAEAINAFQRMLDMDEFPEDARDEILYNLGASNYQLERYATAAHYFQQYQEVHPEDQRVARQIEDSLNRIGASEERNESQGPGAGRRLFQLAQERYEARDFRRAIILFERVRHLERLPDETRSMMLFNAGMSNFHLGRYATAQNYLEEYLAEHPDEANEVQPYLSECQAQVGLTETHEDSSASDDDAQTLFRQGRAAFDASQWQEALTYFRRVMNAQGVSAQIRFTMYHNMAICFRQLNQREEALRYFRFHIQSLTEGTPEYQEIHRLIQEMDGNSEEE